MSSYQQPPHGWFDINSGKYQGIDVEIIEEVLKGLNIKTWDYVTADWGAMIPGLNACRWDIMSIGMTYTKLRSEQVQFSLPVYQYGVAMLVAKGNPKKIKGKADWKGKKVGGIIGSTDDQVIGGVKGATYVPFTKYSRIAPGVPSDDTQLAFWTLEQMLEDARTKLDIANVVVKQIEEKKQEAHKTDSAISSSKKYLKQLQELAEKVQQEKGSLQTERDAMSVLQVEEDGAEAQKKELVEDLHTMEIATVLLKDSGIKRKIIRKYIPALNKIINKYLISMDFFAQFTLNEDFNEIIKSRHRDEFSYDNFSEGEKLRIDLSLLLAWRDIAKMKNCANTNLLILDEVFDSSLDAVGTEEVIKILQSMGGSNNIFVISHKSDQLLDKFQNILTYKKVNNFSKLC